MFSKQTVGLVVLMIGLVVGWLGLRSVLLMKYPELGMPATQPAAVDKGVEKSGGVTQTVDKGAEKATESVPALNAGGSGVGATTTGAGAVGAVYSVENAAVARGAVLGSAAEKDPTYALGLDISPRGAGLNAVVVNEYRQPVTRTGAYTFQNRKFALPSGLNGAAVDAAETVTPLIDVDASRSMSVLSVKVNGQPLAVSSAFWTLTESTGNTATFVLPIKVGGQTAVELVRTYGLKGKAEGAAGGVGYEVETSLELRNKTGSAVTLEVVMNGPATPPFEIERGPERQAVGGYLDKEAMGIEVHPTAIETLTEKNPVVDITHMSGNSQPLMWFGANGSYFNAFLRPERVDGKLGVPDYLEKVEAVLADASADAHRRHMVTRLTTRPLTVGAGQSIRLPFKAYFGPKLRGVLDNKYYGALPFKYDNTLVITGGLCGFCTFQPVIRTLVWMLRMFHGVTQDWGVSIIALVLCVRLLLHPITKRAQMNMMQMAKMGPEIERLKKKYGDDKEGLQQAMGQFYKENGATPILGCLPMLLQTPIWIALYASLQSTFELRQSPFLYGLTWIKDLAQPDHLIAFPTVNLFGWFPISGVNILPFLLAVVFWLQQKLQPKPPASTPEQEQQQKMMQWMTLLFPAFLYNGPAGLNIYILASTTFGILESRHIRKVAKQREESQAAGKIEGSGAFTPATVVTRGTTASGRAIPTEPKTGVMGMLERFNDRLKEAQKMADQMKRQQAKGKKK
jgi:YidC/Oxa1 family membrane protein insertase